MEKNGAMFLLGGACINSAKMEERMQPTAAETGGGIGVYWNRRVSSNSSEHSVLRQVALETDSSTRQSAINRICERYDMRNISPIRIDDLTSELFDAGFEPEGDLMMLMVFGAQFQNAIARKMASHHGFPLDKKSNNEYIKTSINLLETLQEARKMSQSFGVNVDYWDRMISVVKEVDLRAGRPCTRGLSVAEYSLHADLVNSRSEE